MATIDIKVPDIGDFAEVGVIELLVKPGDTVTEGQPLLSIEAMKMEMWLSAQAPGVVKAVHAVPGEQVQAKALLIDIELTKDQ